MSLQEVSVLHTLKDNKGKKNNTGYTIGEISKIVGLPPSTLRYYDKEGLLPMLQRTDGGGRVFNDDACRMLRIIECLKHSGLSIKEIRTYIDLALQGDSTLSQRRALFLKRREALKQELAGLQDTLAVIEYKCWYYETAEELGSEVDVKKIKSEDIPKKFRDAKARLEASLV